MRPATSKAALVQEVIGTLRRHGFTVARAEDPVCTPTLVAQVTNVPSSSLDEYEKVTREDGHLTCNVENRPTGGNVVERWLDDPSKEVLLVANVRCFLYPDDERGAEQAARLDAALANLARSLRKRSNGGARAVATAGRTS